jgi:hypothetical protein
VTALFLGVCLHLLILLFILRRYAPRWAGPAPGAAVPLGAADGAAVPGADPGPTAAENGPAAAAPPESPTAEHFELGPTYEEEMALKREALRRQEESVLRQLFEENLRFRARLAQPPGCEA